MEVNTQKDVDSKGHKTSILIYIRKKVPMSKEGYERFGHMQRINISKSRFVWKPYASSKRDFYKYFPPRGAVPVKHLATDKAIGEFFLNYLQVDDGDQFAIQGFTNKKTRTHIGFTSHLAEVKILSKENRKVEVTKTGRLRHFWFRRDAEKEREQRMR